MTEQEPPLLTQDANLLASLEETLEQIAMNICWFYLGEDHGYQKLRQHFFNLDERRCYLELAPVAYGIKKDRVPCALFEMLYNCQQCGRNRNYKEMFGILTHITEIFYNVYATKNGLVPVRPTREVKAIALRLANRQKGEEKYNRTVEIMRLAHNIKEETGQTEWRLSDMVKAIMAKLEKRFNKKEKDKDYPHGYGRQTVRTVLLEAGYRPSRRYKK